MIWLCPIRTPLDSIMPRIVRSTAWVLLKGRTRRLPKGSWTLTNWENKGAASQLFTIVSHVGMCSDQGRTPPIISWA